MRIVVVGGGRMGLPLASVLAENGADVTVCDINAALCEIVNTGQSPYEEPELDLYIARNVKQGRLSASTDTRASVKTADAVIVIVPAWLTDEKDIDYTILKAASAAIGQGLQAGALVCYETTVAVGGTRTQLIPVLEEHSGMKAGVDFQVAFSPERVKANKVLSRLQKNPKIVGGVDSASAERALQMYSKYLGAPVLNVQTLEAAELSKLAGMLYRDVNIALANELAALSEKVGVDFALVRDAANTDGESNVLLPGIGVGGHCTPVYPYFMIHDANRRGVPQRLSTIAREINDEQPARSVERLAREWKPLKGERVHILGLGFRPDVKVDTFSPAYPLQEALLAKGARVTIEDPMYTDDEIAGAGFTPARAGEDALGAVILNTAHTVFKKADFTQWRASGIEALVDGRNFWDARAVEDAGILYLGIGRDRRLSDHGG
jgi:nucleotide sugar dehydrogenase